jgi:hypothetical protein
VQIECARLRRFPLRTAGDVEDHGHSVPAGSGDSRKVTEAVLDRPPGGAGCNGPVPHATLLAELHPPAVTTVRGASNLLGAVEVVLALLLAARPVAPRLAALGSVGAMGMFLTTLSLLATTPGAWAQVPDFPLPIPGPAGAFLIKDLFLLGAATWSAGEALGAAAGTAAGPTPGRDGDEGAPD